MFSDIISVKKTAIRELSIFGQNPWTNPFGKCPSLALVKPSIVLPYNVCFLSRRSKNDFF